LAQKVGNYFKKNVKFKHDGVKGEDRYVPCIEKASRELNLQNKINLDEAISKTVELLRAHNKYV
jgi:dTDP-D-glucose 4,6-dehydratase